MVKNFITTESNDDFQRLRSSILDGSVIEKVSTILDIGHYRVKQFTELLVESMLSDENPEVRASSFWSLSLIAGEEVGDEMLEALNLEENSDAKSSMYDSFMSFVELYNIDADNIIIESIITDLNFGITELEDGIIDEKSEEVNIYEIVSADSEKIKDLKMEIMHTRTRIKQILMEISPNIPISLHRLVSLTGATAISLERYLTELSTSGILNGKYYPLEQVFIKEERTVTKLLDEITRDDTICRDCGASSMSFPCTHCGNGLQCSVCKLNIGENEMISACPQCMSQAHIKHLTEWIRIKATCPICREKISPISVN